jgi:hypothetical protein
MENKAKRISSDHGLPPPFKSIEPHLLSATTTKTKWVPKTIIIEHSPLPFSKNVNKEPEASSLFIP